MRILVVDDEPHILSVLARTLVAANGGSAEVVTVSNGREALEALEDSSFDVCLLDINLPDMSGLHIMERIRAGTPETGIVVMTGGLVTEEMEKLIREGADAFVGKPFTHAEIREALLVATEKPLRRHPVRRGKGEPAG
jgi:CheY-like chemotaxis protein